MNNIATAVFTNTSTVYKSPRTHIFTGTYADDGEILLLKQSDSLDKDFALSGTCNEWTITRRLDPHYSLIAQDLIEYEQRPLLVFSGAAKTTLQDLLPENGFQAEPLLNASIAIAKSIISIHQSGVIHRDINPRNIVISPDLKAAQLIDFEYASRLDEQEQRFIASKELKGTLAYIAPEQTGRVNHSADHRADLYSLGVTLYQLAYGKTPFAHYSDPAQIIYAHIAEPAPAIDKTEIPRAFGLVLSKLLEKNPKSRYQSGISLLKDLEDIAASLKRGEEPLNFTAAAEDFDTRIVIAEGVFGREREIKSLKQAYENSAKKASILCLRGPSGIGKSAICRELFSTISQTNSFYLAGKYDQFSKGQAYTAISAALTQFVKQAQSDETNNWAQLLQDCISNEAALLTSIVPRFSELLGEQDEIPIMSVKEIKTVAIIYSKSSFWKSAKP